MSPILTSVTPDQFVNEATGGCVLVIVPLSLQVKYNLSGVRSFDDADKMRGDLACA